MPWQRVLFAYADHGSFARVAQHTTAEPSLHIEVADD
jgi:hypothetical protein